MSTKSRDFNFLETQKDHEYHLNSLKNLVKNLQYLYDKKKAYKKEFAVLFNDIRLDPNDDNVNQGGNAYRLKRFFDLIGELMNNNMSINIDFKNVTRDFLKILWGSVISLDKDETLKLKPFEKSRRIP